jgi:transcriptional regulator GlxA family with amidase domain
LTSIQNSFPLNFSRPKIVLLVAFPGMGLLDLTCPQTTFSLASQIREARGFPGYTCTTVSMKGGLVKSIEGLEFSTVSLEQWRESEVDTVLISGSPPVTTPLDHLNSLIKRLREIVPHARRIVSLGTGTFVLAEAGLLDGRRATAHWEWRELLQSRFPAIEVDPDAIVVQAGKFWTCAGFTAGIDLALALVEADCGRAVSMEVAAKLVTYLRRSTGESQLSALLISQMHDAPTFDKLHVWMASNLSHTGLGVDQLAQQANMSLRNFARVYKQKTGRTPAKTLENMRLELARRLLEETDNQIELIARQCGFGDEERMRLTFQRNLGLSPTEYRKRRCE